MRETWVVIGVALAGLIGCGEAAAPARGTAAAVGAPLAGVTQPARVTRFAAPVAMPGGGMRIDARGDTRHALALERQPDGTFKRVCVDAPELARARSTP